MVSAMSNTENDAQQKRISKLKKLTEEQSRHQAEADQEQTPKSSP